MVRNYDPDRPSAGGAGTAAGARGARPVGRVLAGLGFLVLESPEDRERFWVASTPEGGGMQRWLTGMRRAPLIVVPHANRSVYLERYAEPDKGWADRSTDRWPVPYWFVDTGFAALLMMLTAVDEGLGSCFFGIPPQRLESYREAFGVPEAYHPIGALTVGYRAADTGHRRCVADAVRWTRSFGGGGGADPNRWFRPVENRTPGRETGIREQNVGCGVRLRWHGHRRRRSRRRTATRPGVVVPARPGEGSVRRDLQSGPGRASLSGTQPDSEAVGGDSARPLRLDQLITTKRELALDKLLAEDSTFYGDLFPHVVQWNGGLYLEDGLHRALRAALQQRNQIHARVLVLAEAVE